MDNKDIKVSIVVAIYKSEKFLDKLIKSIINQTHKNIEVILVDDGSPDNSGAVCDKYAKQDSRIQVLHKKNGGACDARNKGMELVTGEYMSIIDGDDWLEPDYVEYLLKLCTETGSDMSMCKNIFTTRDRVQVNVDHIETLTPEEAAVQIIYPKIPIGPWAKLYKTSLIKDNHIDFNVPWSGEGHYFTAMAAQYANHVALGYRKVYDYRMNNSGSGLTHYNVVMGTNALWNTKNIGKKLVNPTKRLINAVKYHEWSNYHFILFLITATDSKEKYTKEYHECLAKTKSMLPCVLLHSEIGPRGKVHMILQTLFPIYFAKKELKRSQKALKKDLENPQID